MKLPSYKALCPTSAAGLLLSSHHASAGVHPTRRIGSKSIQCVPVNLRPASTVPQELLSQLSHAVPHPKEFSCNHCHAMAWFPSNPSLKTSFATIPALLSPTKSHCDCPFADTVWQGHRDNLLAFTSYPTARAEVVLLHLSCTSLGSGFQQQK